LELYLSQTDSTDHAPATTASTEEQPATPMQVEAAGYSKIGPGPMASIRFKWTARRADDGNYYVDETIGDTSLPIVTGPMSAEAAMRLVDEREQEALLRFERLRNEIVARGTDGKPAQQNHDEP
jgi:hypothetical protein